MSWSIGTALVLAEWTRGLAGVSLRGFSGWLAEAFMVPRFFRAPLLMLWIIPLSIVSYVLLIVPGMAAVNASLARSSPEAPARTRGYLAALLVPVGCWILAAVLISRYVKI